MQCIKHFIYDVQRYLPRGAGLPGVGEGHGRAESLPSQTAHSAQRAHAHGDDRCFRVKVGHLGSGSQKLQHINAALRHDRHLGQVGPGLLHGNHAVHQFGPRRRLVEVMAGANHRSPGGMGVSDQCGQVIPCRKKLNVNEVSTVGVKDRVEQIGVFRVTQCEFSALYLRADGDEQLLVLQGDPQLCQTAGNSTGDTGTFKIVHAPFHTIGLQC